MRERKSVWSSVAPARAASPVGDGVWAIKMDLVLKSKCRRKPAYDPVGPLARANSKSTLRMMRIASSAHLAAISQSIPSAVTGRDDETATVICLP